MGRNREAIRVAESLSIGYTQALRYVREIGDDYGSLPDLTHACRDLMEGEMRRGPLRKGAGDGCPEFSATQREEEEDDRIKAKYPIQDHLYDAWFPRDDSNGCVFNYSKNTSDTPDICGRPLSEHANSEYPEDGR